MLTRLPVFRLRRKLRQRELLKKLPVEQNSPKKSVFKPNKPRRSESKKSKLPD